MVQDDIAELYFYLRKDKPVCSEDIYTSKSICFSRGKNENQYKVYLCESSKRNRPKDLTLLGKIVDFKKPEKCSSVAMFFSWGNYLYERDILWGYERQIKYEEEN